MTRQLRRPRVAIAAVRRALPHVGRVRTVPSSTPGKPLQSRTSTPFAFFISVRIVA